MRLSRFNYCLFWGLLLLLCGCCHLPLVDVGPKITRLAAEPILGEIGNGLIDKYDIDAFMYEDRCHFGENWLTLHIQLKIVPSDKLVMDEPELFIFNKDSCVMQVNNQFFKACSIANLSYKDRSESNLAPCVYDLAFTLIEENVNKKLPMNLSIRDLRIKEHTSVAPIAFQSLVKFD